MMRLWPEVIVIVRLPFSTLLLGLSVLLIPGCAFEAFSAEIIHAFEQERRIIFQQHPSKH